MNSKPVRYFWIVFLILLAACGKQTGSLTPTNVPATITSILSPVQVSPTPRSTLTPTPIPIAFPPDGLHLAYIIDGNLYFQKGSKPPLQLTKSGQDAAPVFSGDGEKIVFFCGLFPHYVCSINVDGSQEQVIIDNNLLISLNLGYSDKTEPRSFSFVPGTHQLLFNTHEPDPRATEANDLQMSLQYRYDSDPNQDLLLVDIDTGEIKRLLPAGRGGSFKISPDGKMVGVQTIDHIDVIGLDGKVIHRNVVTYPPVYPKIWIPDIYWSQDSSKLNVELPIPTAGILAYTGPEPQTIWQYSLDGSSIFEVPLNPPPMDDWFSFSPDGNWVVYTFADYAKKTNNTNPLGIYIGNLHNGSSQLLNVEGLSVLPHSFHWNPDSTYFVFEDELRPQLFLANVNGDITSIQGSVFRGWLDESRYLYGNLFIGEVGKEQKLKIASGLSLDENSQPLTFILLKQ